jgi:hypothetical protein
MRGVYEEKRGENQAMEEETDWDEDDEEETTRRGPGTRGGGDGGRSAETAVPSRRAHQRMRVEPARTDGGG